jgi:hypothetical protein
MSAATVPERESVQQESSSFSSQEDIERLAYALWEQRGCPIGSPEIDWFEAVKRLGKLPES